MTMMVREEERRIKKKEEEKVHDVIGFRGITNYNFRGYKFQRGEEQKRKCF